MVESKQAVPDNLFISGVLMMGEKVDQEIDAVYPSLLEKIACFQTSAGSQPLASIPLTGAFAPSQRQYGLSGHGAYISIGSFDPTNFAPEINFKKILFCPLIFHCRNPLLR